MPKCLNTKKIKKEATERERKCMDKNKEEILRARIERRKIKRLKTEERQKNLILEGRELRAEEVAESSVSHSKPIAQNVLAWRGLLQSMQSKERYIRNV